MKKITLSIIAVLAFGFANAQGVKFGVKGGISLTNLTGDDIEDNSSKVGFLVGGFAEIKLTEKFAIQPELLFATQGTKFEADGDDLKYNLNYLNVPVMAKFYVADKFSLEAGPQIGFLLSAKAKAGDEDEDVKDFFKSVDFGVNFGAGYDFTENLSAGVRYNLGLANILDTEEGNDSKIKNSVFSLAVGYKF
jgi:opacity protein-like surface antigen